jgi:hypothetical protein
MHLPLESGGFMKINKYINGLRFSKFIPIAFILLCVAAFGMGTWSSGVQPTPQEDKLPPVRNETESFQLVSAEKSEKLLKLKLRNTSQKVITSYTVAFSDGFKTNIDKILGNDLIGPGQVEEIEFPLSHIFGSGSSKSREPSLTILAVIFADKSGEGDFKATADILNDRLGQKIQLERISRLMHDALKASDNTLPAALRSLADQVSLLSEEPDQGQPSAVHFGLHYIKQRILRQIEELQQWVQNRNSLRFEAEFASGGDLREALINLKKFSEKKIPVL